MAKPPKTRLKPETRLVTAGRDPQAYHGYVNPPVYHASTVLYPTAEDSGRAPRPLSVRPPRHADLGSAGKALIATRRATAAPASRCCRPDLAAISTALLSVAGAGDHILVTDSAYRPTRSFCDERVHAHGRRDDLLRSAHRRRHRQAVQAEYARGVRRGAGLAELRDAGHPGDRARRARQRRAWC